MRIHDISLPLSPDTPIYPGDPPFRLRFHQRLEKGHPYTLSSIFMSSHTGTHIDAPSHFIQDAGSVETLPLNALIGPAYVCRVGPGPISSATLESLGIPQATQRLLLRTRLSGWGSSTESESGLLADAAQWLVERGVNLVGIDQLSIEGSSAGDRGYPAHHLLLGAGIVILEGLDLSSAPLGLRTLYCLPLKILKAEGAPARAVLV
ncbi:MAG: cyclase family protein [SAR202 cluster bacterium]|nr:cyclase family protein [SAR202 cluster bacterium]